MDIIMLKSHSFQLWSLTAPKGGEQKPKEKFLISEATSPVRQSKVLVLLGLVVVVVVMANKQ